MVAGAAEASCLHDRERTKASRSRPRCERRL